MSIYRQEALPLALYHNTVNITTYHISPNQQITAHGVMHLQIETVPMFVSTAFLEKNQQHANKFYKPSHLIN